MWYSNGLLHRNNNPAVIYRRSSGGIYFQEWYYRGMIHRVDGPAIIWYDEFGKITSEYWFQNGKYHRTDGPAVISNEIESISWWINGKRIHLEQWLKENRYKWPLTEDQQTELILKFA